MGRGSITVIENLFSPKGMPGPTGEDRTPYDKGWNAAYRVKNGTKEYARNEFNEGTSAAREWDRGCQAYLDAYEEAFVPKKVSVNA